MDPATGTLTLVGAAVSTIKVLERERDARKYPKECSTIFAEVTDLKHTLHRCLATAESDKSISVRFNAFGFTELVTTANDKLQALSDQLRAGTAPNGLGSVKELLDCGCARQRSSQRIP